MAILQNLVRLGTIRVILLIILLVEAERQVTQTCPDDIIHRLQKG